MKKYLKDIKPDYIIIFPWNIREEIIKQLNYISNVERKFVISVPVLRYFNSHKY